MINFFTRSIENLSIRTKLLFAFSSQIVLGLLITLIIFVASLAQDHALKISQDATQGSLAAANLQIDLLQARRREKDFLLRYFDSGYESAYKDYIVPFGQHIIDIQIATQQLTDLEKTKNPGSETPQSLKTIQTQIANYQTTFMKVVDVKIPDRESFIGQMNSLVMAITNMVGSDDPTLTIQMQELRQGLAVYQLHTLPGHATLAEFTPLHETLSIDLTAKISAIQLDASHLHLSGENQITLIRNINDLYNTFNTLVETDATIARYIENYRVSVHEVEPLASTIVTDASVTLENEKQNLQTTENNTRIFVIMSVIASLLAGLTVIILIGRSIANALKELTDATRQMGVGDYSQRVNVVSRDEFGQLGQTFNEMAETVLKRDHQLQEAVIEAHEANRLKDEFLATMSHELRTPLNATIGFLGIIQSKNVLDEKNVHRLNRARANAERLLHLINDILDISRIEAGRLTLAYAPLHIRNLVGGIKSQMDVLADEKGLHFTTEISDSMPEMITTDEDAILKIMINLLSNAFKFTEQGSVSLKLSMSDTNLMIEVKDSGAGIPYHMQDVIFERFRQVDGSSKRLHGGTGLGLAIVSSLCQQMEGKISVRSAPGEGSVFTVSLPITEALKQTA